MTSDMGEFINQRVKLHIRKNGANLYFTATITHVSPTHISFLDRYNEPYTFKKAYVEQVQRA